MDHQHQDYINDSEFQSNSPSSVQINISPQPSPFDTFEFGDVQNPSFAHSSSSYNGSYHSPFSNHSELSFGENETLNLFEDQSNIREYDPSEYDPPNSSGLLMFDNNDYLPGMENQVSVSVVPAPEDHRSPHNFDYSSPSSNGGPDSGPDGEIRSRASSVSSNHHHPSPRLDVAQSLENMTFRSPNWGTSPLPTDRPISPPQKPQSPPQLMIPDSGSPGPSFPQSPPIINAPSGEGGGMGHGLSLNIVPATPVGGDRSVPTAVPYQQRMDTSRQGQAQNGRQSNPQGWNPQMQHADEEQGLGVGHFREQAQLSYTFPQHSHNDVASGLSTSNAMQSQSQYNNHSNNENTNDFLFPSSPGRVRSKSDTSLQPQWTSPFIHDQFPNDNNSAVEDTAGTVNMNDVLPTQQRPSSAGGHQTSFPNLSTSHLNQNSPFNQTSNFLSASSFLSPEMGANIRRSQSDSGPRGHRPSRSEDMRHSGALLYPPISQQSAAQDYLRTQFLHPQETVPAIRGHFRRASSGSRGSRGEWSNPSSSRPSPYPSPHASPRVPYEDLPNDLSNVPLAGREPMLQAEQGLDVGQESEPGTIVSKPNVTTGRTANASHKRRKQDANFKCPVPGCGSTFTRSFNLKGHLRSHNEEKPFLCKWPGCNKGFARQHDCKRHEQLHSNYRPFICEGCTKPFARMDALNRHLKSEGGADCMRLLAEAGREAMTPRGYRQPPPPTLSMSVNLTKMEPDFGNMVVL